MKPIASQRQYDLAKRDRERITQQIAKLSEGFDAEIAQLQTAIDVKTAARDQATGFLRSECAAIDAAINEWNCRRGPSPQQPLKVAAGGE